MWAKFNIDQYKIPMIYNTGFTIDSKNNYITNIEKNYKIKVPFNINTSNEIYYFELLSTDNILTLTLIININLINTLLKINAIIPYKTNLFKILKKSYNNNSLKIYNFKKYNNILDIIDNKYTNINYSKIIIINNLYFDLVSEQILTKQNDYLKLINNNCNIFFLFGKCLNFNISKYKLCIIDDNYKLIDKITINKDNYKLINKDFFIQNTLINIDRKFFFSKKYIKPYKIFHSNSRSKHAFVNYKKYIDDKSITYPVYNIELFKDYLIIIKDTNISNLINHPILHSNNCIFIINDSININKIESCEKILKNISKNNHLNYKLVLDNHLYLDSNKYLLYSKYKEKDIVNFNIYIIPNIEVTINIFTKKVNIECPINKNPINYNTYAKLNCKCNNLFCYYNLWLYFNTHNICPYCSNIITHINVFVHTGSLLVNLFGTNFNKYYSDKMNYVYLYKNSNIVNTFLENIDNVQVYKSNDISIEDINPNTYLILEHNISFYDMLNSFNNSEVRNINKIIKFSPSI